jgi:predicted  nucleic acid-binding Zn-ribbon protein
VTILETEAKSMEKQFSEYKAEHHTAMRDIMAMFTELQKSIESNFKEIRSELHEIDKRKP